MDKNTFSLIDAVLVDAAANLRRDAYHLSNSGQEERAKADRRLAARVDSARQLFQTECSPKDEEN